MEESTIFFFGPENNFGFLSNWYKVEFNLEFRNIREEPFLFSNVEQAMMAGKASLMDDKESFNKIIKETEPKKVKALGRKVKNFDEKLWNKYKKVIVKTAVIAKFTQNPELLEQLLSTGNSYLAEASPYDKVWGIGTKSEKLKTSKK